MRQSLIVLLDHSLLWASSTRNLARGLVRHLLLTRRFKAIDWNENLVQLQSRRRVQPDFVFHCSLVAAADRTSRWEWRQGSGGVASTQLNSGPRTADQSNNQYSKPCQFLFVQPCLISLGAQDRVNGATRGAVVLEPHSVRARDCGCPDHLPLSPGRSQLTSMCLPLRSP
jgi:hypothetical protein